MQEVQILRGVFCGVLRVLCGQDLVTAKVAEEFYKDEKYSDWAYSIFRSPAHPPFGLRCVALMGPLLRDRILLLQFLCVMGALGPAIGSVHSGVKDRNIKTQLDRDDPGWRAS
jgi:hypothetical protein